MTRGRSDKEGGSCCCCWDCCCCWERPCTTRLTPSELDKQMMNHSHVIKIRLGNMILFKRRRESVVLQKVCENILSVSERYGTIFDVTTRTLLTCALLDPFPRKITLFVPWQIFHNHDTTFYLVQYLLPFFLPWMDYYYYCWCLFVGG